MTQFFRTSRIFLLLAALTSGSVLAESALKPGEGYETLSASQHTQDASKVEVIEFFWYGCPHCYQFEPHIAKWSESLPADVQFIRQPAIFSKKWVAHARIYFTAEALGVVDKVHADLFDAIQNKHQDLQKESDIAHFFVAHGVDKAAFKQAYDSFVVNTKMRQAQTMTARYGITGVPAVVINGKYKTSGSLAKSYENVIQIVNQLIDQERSSLKPAK